MRPIRPVRPICTSKRVANLAANVFNIPMTLHKQLDVCRRFGAAIRKRRLYLGLSQKEMADRANCHPHHVSAVERGANISCEMMLRFAKALKTSAYALTRSAGI